MHNYTEEEYPKLDVFAAAMESGPPPKTREGSAFLHEFAKSLVRLCRIVDKPKGCEFKEPYLGSEIPESLSFEIETRVQEYVASRFNIPMEDRKYRTSKKGTV